MQALYELWKNYLVSLPNRSLAYFFLGLFIFFFIGISILYIVSDDKRELTIQRVDIIGLVFGLITLFFTILMTIKIQMNSEKLSSEIAKEHQNDNDILLNTATKIQDEVRALLNQFKNVIVVTKFTKILSELEELYEITINASEGKLEKNGSKTPVKMKLKIMNHSASFGKLLCNSVSSLKEFDDNFDKTCENKVELRKKIDELIVKQRQVFYQMNAAFKKADDEKNNDIYKNKYYITLSGNKNIQALITENNNETAYYTKYLSKIELNKKTCHYESYDPLKSFIQIREGDLEDHFITKQKKHINDLSEICSVYDVHASTIPFQVFITLPVDDTISNEHFYKCILFFINDNTIGKEVPLTAISTSNIEFVKSIEKVLDAEKEGLVVFSKS